MTMRRGALALSVFLSVGTAAMVRADAIAMSDGTCPPGLRAGVVHHEYTCTPIPCSTDAECGDGAACHELSVCTRQREVSTLDGRVVLAEPRRIWVEEGLCHGGAHDCEGGRCGTRHQCEPTEPTPSFDPERHAFTGTWLPPAPPPPPPPPPTTTTAPPTTTPPASQSWTCAVAQRFAAPSRAIVAVALAVALALSARRARRVARHHAIAPSQPSGASSAQGPAARVPAARQPQPPLRRS